MHWSSARSHRTGFSRADLLAIVSCTIAGLGVLAPVLGQSRLRDAIGDSLNNLRVLHGAIDCYARDWDDRQFTAVPDDYGVYDGDCPRYADETGCYPPLILGWGCTDPIRLYAFRVECDIMYMSLSCGGNQKITLPLNLDPEWAYASARLPNARPLAAYVSGRFYDPVFYASADTVAYPEVKPLFQEDCEFAGENGRMIPSTYALSPAAMYHPDVFRAPSDGGFQHPSSLPWGYESPALSQVLHPDLKTLMLEHNWMRGAPGPCHPTFEDRMYGLAGGLCSPWVFNQGADAEPVTLYFDGSIETLPTDEAVRGDQRVLEQTGGIDGLWSRDTPFGAEGYFGEFAYDGTIVSHHMLTTDGIRGRDRLAREGTSITGAQR